MHKKDYELIAECILQESGQSSFGIEQEMCDRLAKRLANKLAEKNPRFNREKFLKACGIK